MILSVFVAFLTLFIFAFAGIYAYNGMSYTEALYTSVMTQTLIGIPEPVSANVKKAMIAQAILSYVLTTVVVVRSVRRISRTAPSPVPV
jgi:hypothetical protein